MQVVIHVIMYDKVIVVCKRLSQNLNKRGNLNPNKAINERKCHKYGGH